MPRPCTDTARVTTVLDGVTYTATTGQLLAQADYYGADIATRAALGNLQVGTYSNLEAVLAVLRETGVLAVTVTATRTMHLPAQHLAGQS